MGSFTSKHSLPDLLHGASSVQGIRPYNEDRYSIHHPLLSQKAPKNHSTSMFGVYDGHGGEWTATFAEKNMPECICTQSTFLSKNHKEKSLVRGFWQCDNKILTEQEKGSEKSGTTAVIVLIDHHYIYVGNTGDSRALLYKANSNIINEAINNNTNNNGNSSSSSNNNGPKYSVHELSVDHKPILPEEKKRIENAGGRVNPAIPPPHIKKSSHTHHNASSNAAATASSASASNHRESTSPTKSPLASPTVESAPVINFPTVPLPVSVSPAPNSGASSSSTDASSAPEAKSSSSPSSPLPSSPIAAYKSATAIEDDGLMYYAELDDKALAVSRALGNLLFKQNPNFGASEQVIIAIPHIKKLSRTPPYDAFLLLGSDGLFNFMRNDACCELILNKIYKRLAQQLPVLPTGMRPILSNTEVDEIASELTQTAIDRKSNDNVTVVIIIFKEWLDSIPLDELKQWRTKHKDELDD